MKRADRVTTASSAKQEAVRRLKHGLGNVRTNFGHLLSVDEETWNGDRLTFRVRALGRPPPAH